MSRGRGHGARGRARGRGQPARNEEARNIKGVVGALIITYLQAEVLGL